LVKFNANLLAHEDMSANGIQPRPQVVCLS
jgi:hypothetical protein